MGSFFRGVPVVVAVLTFFFSVFSHAQQTNSYIDQILSSNPIAYWPIESKQYDELVGNYPNFSEGDNLPVRDTGLNIGSAVETFSRFGNLHFSSELTPFDDVFSFAVWVKVYSLNGRQVIFQQGGEVDGNTPFSLYIAGVDKSYESGLEQKVNHFTFLSGDGAVLLSDSQPVEVDVWN